jgi:hypothetical protein
VFQVFTHGSKLNLLKLLLHIQVEDVRLRLNVDVTVTLDSPPAPAPVESFTDMVIFCILYLVWTGLVSYHIRI